MVFSFYNIVIDLYTILCFFMCNTFFSNLNLAYTFLMAMCPLSGWKNLFAIVNDIVKTQKKVLIGDYYNYWFIFLKLHKVHILKNMTANCLKEVPPPFATLSPLLMKKQMEI